LNSSVVTGEVWPAQGLSPRAQNSKMGGAVGPKIKKWQKPRAEIKKKHLDS